MCATQELGGRARVTPPSCLIPGTEAPRSPPGSAPGADSRLNNVSVHYIYPLYTLTPIASVPLGC